MRAQILMLTDSVLAVYRTDPSQRFANMRLYPAALPFALLARMPRPVVADTQRFDELLKLAHEYARRLAACDFLRAS
jgi:hypothetical protein